MIWVKINNTNGKYSVSNTGLIRNNLTNKILKGSWTGKTKTRNRTPYKCHGLLINGKRVFSLTHRIVAKHFIPNTENKPQINHINKNVQDNRVENLEWVDNQENSRHYYKKKIVQKNLNGETVKVWDGLYSIGDAGFNKSKVCMVLNDNYPNKTSYGYLWEYGV